jgi:hypothetical protein
MPISPAEEEKDMRSRNCKFASTMVALVLALTFVPGALAQCGLSTKLIKPANWSPSAGGPHLARTAFDDDDHDGHDGQAIVGMWHVLFVAHTQNGEPIPSNAYPTIDNALVVWHSDGTEIMNSYRPPQDGNFCLGVWKQTGRRQYFLNHLPWFANQFPNGTNNGIGDPVGPTQITEQVTLSDDGNSYSGTFTLRTYGTDGTPGVWFSGVVSGTRVTTSTTVPGLL